VVLIFFMVIQICIVSTDGWCDVNAWAHKIKVVNISWVFLSFFFDYCMVQNSTDHGDTCAEIHSLNEFCGCWWRRGKRREESAVVGSCDKKSSPNEMASLAAQERVG